MTRKEARWFVKRFMRQSLTLATVAAVIAAELLPSHTDRFGMALASMMMMRPKIQESVSGRSRFVRPNQSNSLLPYGKEARNDVFYNEATDVVSSRDHTSALVWDWDKVRDQSARQAAATKLTCTDVTDFLAKEAIAAAGSGDYEITCPASMTWPTRSDATWEPVRGISGDRWLFIKGANVPTADVMPSTDDIHASSVWVGPSGSSVNEFIKIGYADMFGLTFTGIEIQVNEEVTQSVIGITSTDLPVASEAALPGRVVFDRSWINSDNFGQTRRAVTENGRQIAYLESWFTNIDMDSGEVTGMNGWQGTRWVYGRNIYVESRGLCRLLGGTDPFPGNVYAYIPQDVLIQNYVGAKKQVWIGTLKPGIKNNDEAKDADRYAIFNGILNRHINTGQAYVSLFQNLSDTNDNLNENRISNISRVNFWVNECQDGLNLVAQVGFMHGTFGSVVGTTTTVSGDNNVPFVDGVLDGRVIIATPFGGGTVEIKTVVTYTVPAGVKTLVVDTAFSGAIGAGATFVVYNPPVPTHPASNLSFINYRWTGLGINQNDGRAGQQLELQGALQNVCIDKHSWAGPGAGPDVYGIMNLTNGSGLWLTNLVGNMNDGISNDNGAGGTAVGVAQMLANIPTAVWDGNVVWGRANVSSNAPGATLYTDAADAGFNLTTTVLTGPARTQGVDGGLPGCDNDRLDAAFASMMPWAFSR